MPDDVLFHQEPLRAKSECIIAITANNFLTAEHIKTNTLCINGNTADKMKLKDIAHIRAGHAFRKKLINDPGHQTQVIQMKDLQLNGEIKWGSMIKTAPAAISREWVKKADLLLVSRGANNTAYYIGEEPPAPSLAAPYFFHITLLPRALEAIEPEFIAWQLNQKPIQDYFRKNAEGSTSKAIRREIVENVEIVVPPIKQQRCIFSLNNNIARQRRAHEQLIDNNEVLMSKIASDLLK